MKTPSSSNSKPALAPQETRPSLPPNLSEWLAFGQQLLTPQPPPRLPLNTKTSMHSGLSSTKTAAPRAALALAALLSCAAPLAADSLWRDDAGPTMLADKKAIGVGDILTIVVSENTSNSKSTSTKTAKNNAVDASLSSFFYPPTASGFLVKGGSLPALKFDNKNSFDGGGQIANSETITARVAVRVVDVLPNKNLVIEGTRHTSSAGETQDIVLRGTVRALDVQTDNTVMSYNIADATIKITGKGAISDSQKRGWFTKFWEKVSPF